jgi:hypothetical protein
LVFESVQGCIRHRGAASQRGSPRNELFGLASTVGRSKNNPKQSRYGITAVLRIERNASDVNGKRPETRELHPLDLGRFEICKLHRLQTESSGEHGVWRGVVYG